MRELRQAPVITPPDGLYDEFSARFPYEETEDQTTSINAVLDDLASGRPMDRLICGDVGFGKTEVALRASLLAVLAGKQVAVVVPTTLLARQHFSTFTERFRGLPVKIAQASRLVAGKELAEVKKGIKDGAIDIVIGTHALLGKAIDFANLGLLIIDEEQHFGVQHKERLKQLREDVHVLTLTATPIPRTLQLALSGVREMSVIATPPVDRLAVRTYVTPFDPVILREALLRERYRGGQTFYVVPRISDLDDAAAFLQEHAPELKVARAHGQMASRELEDVMNAFYDGQYDVLLSTSIVESGLDIPTANTLIVHRADMFGLAQLYQLRGRVGRSKVRAYAYFTMPADARLTRPPRSGSRSCNRSIRSAPASRSPATTSTSAAPAICWARSSPATSARSASSSISPCWRRRWRRSRAGRCGERGSVEPADLARHLGADPGELCRRPAAAPRALSPPVIGGEAATSRRSPPSWSTASASCRRRSGTCSTWWRSRGWRQAGVEQVDAGPKGAVIAFRKKSSPIPRGWSRSCRSRAASRCSPTTSWCSRPIGTCRKNG